MTMTCNSRRTQITLLCCHCKMVTRMRHVVHCYVAKN